MRIRGNRLESFRTAQAHERREVGFHLGYGLGDREFNVVPLLAARWLRIFVGTHKHGSTHALRWLVSVWAMACNATCLVVLLDRGN